MSSHPFVYFSESRQLPKPAVLRRLAKALQLSLRIPQDDSLVCFLGGGWERDNIQALETWIKNTLMALDDDGVRILLPWLINRLECELLRLEASL